MTFSPFLYDHWNKGTADFKNTMVPVFVFILFIKRQTANDEILSTGNNSDKNM